MTLVGKAGSIIGAMGLVGGGLATVNYFYKGFRNVSERLNGIGFKVLDVNKDWDWTAIEEEYKKVENKGKRFSGTLNTARKNCKIALQANPNDPNYKLASQWCVKPEKMQDMLSRNKYKKIEKDAEGNKNNEKWKKKLELLNKFGGIKKFATNFAGNNENDEIAALEQECGKIITEGVVTHSDDNFEEKYLQAREWCAEKEVTNA